MHAIESLDQVSQAGLNEISVKKAEEAAIDQVTSTRSWNRSFSFLQALARQAAFSAHQATVFRNVLISLTLKSDCPGARRRTAPLAAKPSRVPDERGERIRELGGLLSRGASRATTTVAQHRRQQLSEPDDDFVGEGKIIHDVNYDDVWISAIIYVHSIADEFRNGAGIQLLYM